MKTKAQRKAARWARKANLKRVLTQHGDKLWFRELEASHGTRLACIMTLDAENCPSFTPDFDTCHGGVVMWMETNYKDRWVYTDYIV